MDFNELTLFFEHVTGVSSKTGKPYDFYKIYTIVYGVKVYLFAKDRTGQKLIENYVKEIDNDNY